MTQIALSSYIQLLGTNMQSTFRGACNRDAEQTYHRDPSLKICFENRKVQKRDRGSRAVNSRDEMKYRDVRPAVRVSVATHRAGFVEGQISKFEISVHARRARGKKGLSKG